MLITKHDRYYDSVKEHAEGRFAYLGYKKSARKQIPIKDCGEWLFSHFHWNVVRGMTETAKSLWVVSEGQNWMYSGWTSAR